MRDSTGAIPIRRLSYTFAGGLRQPCDLKSSLLPAQSYCQPAPSLKPPNLTPLTHTSGSRTSTARAPWPGSVSYTHLRAHETPEHLVCRLLLEKKKKKKRQKTNSINYTHN